MEYLARRQEGLAVPRGAWTGRYGCMGRRSPLALRVGLEIVGTGW